MTPRSEALQAILQDKHSTDAERELANRELTAPQEEMTDPAPNEDAKSMWIGMDHARYLRITKLLDQR
jgi:hypothetical protein